MPVALVVDDSAEDRAKIEATLGPISDLKLQYVGNVSEALQSIEASKPDFVIAQLELPRMDGLDLLVQLAKDHCSLPVVLITDHVSPKIVVTGLRLGAATYVPKNQIDTFLYEAVESLLQVCRNAQVSDANLPKPLGHGELVFSVGNDAEMIPTIIGYVQNLATVVGLCDDSSVLRVCIAVEEALRNAMFHGNLEITSEVREGDPEIYEAMLNHRLAHAPWDTRKLHIRFHIDENLGTFTIRDEGPGFDPTKLPDPTDPTNLDKVSGRGLLLIRTFMDEVHFNRTGNEITMIKRRAAAEEAA